MAIFTQLPVDQLPVGWRPAFFGDLVSFRMGKTPPRNEPAYWDAPTFPWVSISDMSPYGTIVKTAESVSEVAHQDVFRRQLVPAGHLLMSFKLTIGRVAKLGISAYHNEAIISFRPKHPDVDEDFLFYYLSQIEYAAYRDKAIKGDTLNKSKLNRLEIALPPLDEQRQIAALLSAMQRTIERQKQLTALTIELKKCLMQKLFTEGARGEPLKQTEIGLVPDSWIVDRLDSFCVLQRGFDITKDQQTDGPVPVVSSGGIKSYHNIARAAGPGVVVGRKGTLGTVHYVEGPHWPHDTTLWVKDFRGNDPRFTAYFLDRLDFARFDSGASNPTLNRNTVHSEIVAYPPLEQQHEIAVTLGAIERKNEVHQRYVASMRSLFRTLLYKLMTAQIRVHDLDLSALEEAQQNPVGAF